MEFFFVTKDFNIGQKNSTSNINVNLIAPDLESVESNDEISKDHVYCSTPSDLAVIQRTLDREKRTDVELRWFQDDLKKQIFDLEDFPICLTNYDNSKVRKNLELEIPTTPFVDLETKIKPLLEKGQQTVKVGIINGMGSGIGDNVIGIRALQIFHEHLSKYFSDSKIEIELLQPPFNTNIYKRKILQQEKIINKVSILPVTLNKITSYDLIVDLSTMVKRENFNTQPIIDFYLECMAIDPTSIPNEQKRNFVKINEKVKQEQEVIFKTLKQDNVPLIMVHTKASVQLRTMPGQKLREVVKALLEKTTSKIIFSHEVDLDFLDNSQKKRVICLKDRSQDIDEFINIISNVDAMITVDTCSYHIADSFNIPTLVLFTNIEPDLRVKYYPYVDYINLGGDDNDIKNIHVSVDKEHWDLAEKMWDNLDTKQMIDKLENVIEEKSTKIQNIVCPICKNTTEFKTTDRYLNFQLITCDFCESEFTEPRIMENYDQMYENDYEHYIKDRSRKDIVNGYMKQWRFDDIKKFLSVFTCSKYLDVGCANGFLVAYAKDQGLDAYGIDAGAPAIKFAQEKMDLQDRVAICSDLKKLPEPFPSKFNIISSFELVEHLDDPNQFAQDIYDRLDHGGYWIFSTPNRNRLPFKMGVKNPSRHSGLPGGDYPAEHLTRFTQKGHRVLIEQNGFKIVYQNTTKLGAITIADAVGAFPAISVTDPETNRTIPIDRQALNNAVFNYYQPLGDVVRGYGNFIITIARKV